MNGVSSFKLPNSKAIWYDRIVRREGKTEA